MAHKKNPTKAKPSPGVRLQKVMAEAGVASRRECEALIEAGRVAVNGKRITELPVFVDPDEDNIEVDGQRLRPRKSAQRAVHTTVMLNKPKRLISTAHDPQGRRTVVDLVPLPQRLYPIGRLDADSTGLILLTDDGELTNRLTHPRYEVPKRYRVTVRGKLSDDDVERLRKGLYLAPTRRGKADAKKAAAEQVRVLRRYTDRTRGDRTDLSITLREGQNREVRRLLARLGFKVRRLHRVAIGPLQLKGLAMGEFRKLTPTELGKLRKAAGL